MLRQILFAFSIFLAAIAVFFAVKKIPELIRPRQLPQEYRIDATEDLKGLGYTGQRKIAMDASGNMYVAYRKKFRSHSEIFVARVSFSDRKADVRGTDKPIATVDAADQRVPSVAIDSRGVIHVVWYGSDDKDNQNERQVKYARSSDYGDSWSPWRNIAYVSGYDEDEDFWQEHPSLLVGNDDVLYVVWEGKDERNGNQQIKFSRSGNGGDSFTPWKNINTSPDNTQSRPSLVEDENGALHLFMYSSRGNDDGIQAIEHSVSTDQGDTWSTWEAISDSRFDARHPSAAIDGSGVIHVVWRSQIAPSGSSQILYRSLTDGRWGKIVPVSTSPRYQFFPNVGTDGNGNVFVSWMETADASDFPRDDPRGGFGFVSFFKKGVFQEKIPLGDGNRVLYPNAPLLTGKRQSIPIIYEQSKGTGYEIKLRMLE